MLAKRFELFKQILGEYFCNLIEDKLLEEQEEIKGKQKQQT